MNHEIAVSGRVRLARNYHDLTFCDQKNASTCLQRAYEAMHTGTEQLYTLHVLNNMTKEERLSLMEEHLVSADLLKNAMIGAALIRSDRRVSIMINEEDHLRIQAIEPGGNLEKAAQEAFEAETAGGLTGNAQGGDGGTGAGDGADHDARVMALLYQILAGVGNGGAAGIGDQGAGFAV